MAHVARGGSRRLLARDDAAAAVKASNRDRCVLFSFYRNLSMLAAGTGAKRRRQPRTDGAAGPRLKVIRIDKNWRRYPGLKSALDAARAWMGIRGQRHERPLVGRKWLRVDFQHGATELWLVGAGNGSPVPLQSVFLVVVVLPKAEIWIGKYDQTDTRRGVAPAGYDKKGFRQPGEELLAMSVFTGNSRAGNGTDSSMRPSAWLRRFQECART